ncbi:LuxR family transcriptional regulator [Roseibium suaedae]|uniref:LuxR family transcriptional regulator, quorum sensing-dependent transcriptional regulator n=1 Tax=Roseibium suaedae TaxID=735517 RepID=A0A1M7MVC5_9HYPH|nr:LuxR family transcriptional regulator [Roseibium suaedae]SHM94553.1 LuxR family transcriptional regulator, quorum sensing-dependent transcriptional regulator [Roseibium suaedae]
MQTHSLNRALEFTESISGRSNVAQISQDLKHLTESFGYSNFVLATFARHGIHGTPCIISTCWSDEWTRRYLDSHYIMDDPVVARGMRTSYPFSWREMLADPDLSEKGQQILLEARDFDMADGLYIPIYGPRGYEGTLAFGGQRVALQNDESHALHLAGLYAYRQGLQIACPDLAEEPIDNPLTGREIECLKWTSEGKTSGEIGDRLGISRHTVDWYIKEATRKLNAANRAHAVATAMRHKLIG